MKQISRTNITVPATVRAAKGPSLLAHKIVSENHLQGCQQLLSLACGIALDEAFMVEQCDISILGVDLDDEILSDAMKKETDRLTFMKHDVTQPFPFTSIYDCVYSRNLLHYFNKKQQRHILENIFNVLKPNGLFVFQLKTKSDYFYVNPDIKKVRQPDGMIYFPSLGYCRNHLDEREVEELLSMTQYEIKNLFFTTEHLYEDSHKSTLINCFARKG
jgi:SAM-dependent methyltransferase